MAEELERLVLRERHAELGARFVPFAGFEMPIQYSGIIAEHHVVRQRVGVFDVSHMGNFFFTGEDAVAAVDQLVSNDIGALPVGKAAYTVMCREDGGIVDDLIVYKLSESNVMAIVNASRANDDFAHMQARLSGRVELQDRSKSFVLLAVQGPRAIPCLEMTLETSLAEVPSFAVKTCLFGPHQLTCARTGYTGEDGFEILIPNEAALAFFDRLFEKGREHGIEAIGLGARDTLRLEAKLPLYGNDISLDTNPLEAGLAWCVKLDKPKGFIGRDALREIKAKGLSRRMRAVAMRGKGVLRPGYAIFNKTQEVGSLTSGTLSPTLGFAVGMAYVDLSSVDSKDLEVDIRGRRFPIELSPKPFYQRPQ
ncbi:MAG: glycine cleavage system aminomethyltransferase GcvT [Myxococcota bacterium]|jgi:aminomethyltransferase|nr:glycine cleavage system aminomethyltransferase GcvT [Myxococcota bacterium]